MKVLSLLTLLLVFGSQNLFAQTICYKKIDYTFRCVQSTRTKLPQYRMVKGVCLNGLEQRLFSDGCNSASLLSAKLSAACSAANACGTPIVSPPIADEPPILSPPPAPLPPPPSAPAPAPAPAPPIVVNPPIVSPPVADEPPILSPPPAPLPPSLPPVSPLPAPLPPPSNEMTSLQIYSVFSGYANVVGTKRDVIFYEILSPQGAGWCNTVKYVLPLDTSIPSNDAFVKGSYPTSNYIRVNLKCPSAPRTTDSGSNGFYTGTKVHQYPEGCIIEPIAVQIADPYRKPFCTIP